jgi:solute carrier family 10 (sodium/bile acid cotransporter), member 7
MKILEKLKPHWFSLTMLGLFFLAWLSPNTPGFLNSGGWTKTGAVVLIFFLTGLSMRTEEILRGFTNWRLHFYIQGFCYIFFPLFCWIVLKIFGSSMNEGLVIGFTLLAVLPITITSCVVLTQISGGNSAGALFNAVAGNLIGIIVTPALFLLMLGASDMSVNLDTLKIILKLGRLVLAPLIAGQIVHLFFREKTKEFKKIASLTNRWAILLIVYLAFGKIFTDDSTITSVSGMILPLAMIIPGHLIILMLSGAGARLFGFGEKDRIAILFCAPQKTLAMGLPLIAAVLSTRPDLEALASLPIIIYHPTQLLVAGFLEGRFRSKKNN